MSQTSRSCQSAVGQTRTTLGTCSPSSTQTWMRTRGASRSPERTASTWKLTAKRFGLDVGLRARPQVPGRLRSRPFAPPQ